MKISIVALALAALLASGAGHSQDAGTTEIRSIVWYRSLAGAQQCNVPLPVGANDTINGSYTYYLPPDVPDPVGIAGLSIDNESNWPADVTQPAGPWFAAVDPGATYVTCAKWPRQVCPIIGTDIGANPGGGLKLLGVLNVGPGGQATSNFTPHNPPVYYHRGDAIVIATPCYTADQSTSKTVNPALSFQMVFPKYTRDTACDTNTRLLLHGKSFPDPASGEPLTHFVSDSSPNWHQMSAGATIDTVTPAALGQSSSIKFDGTSGTGLWTNASADWKMGSGDWTLEMWWRPGNMTAGVFQQIAVVDGKGPFSLGQIGNKFSFAYSTDGVNWVPSPVQWGTLSLATWTHVVVQRHGASVLLSQDGALVQTIPVSGALFNKDTPLRFGNSADSLYPATGNMQEGRISKTARFPTGSYTVPTTPYACP